MHVDELPDGVDDLSPPADDAPGLRACHDRAQGDRHLGLVLLRVRHPGSTVSEIGKTRKHRRRLFSTAAAAAAAIAVRSSGKVSVELEQRQTLVSTTTL